MPHTLHPTLCIPIFENRFKIHSVATLTTAHNVLAAISWTVVETSSIALFGVRDVNSKGDAYINFGFTYDKMVAYCDDLLYRRNIWYTYVCNLKEVDNIQIAWRYGHKQFIDSLEIPNSFCCYAIGSYWLPRI